MNPNKLLSRAMTMLQTQEYSCVLCDDNRVLTSKRTGIAPLLSLLDAGEDLRGMAAADRIVGKAAAFLLLCGGVRAVYGEVMSRKARELLEHEGVLVRYGTLVDAIRNRADTDICPMERAVLALNDPADAPKVPALLHATLERLKQGQA